MSHFIIRIEEKNFSLELRVQANTASHAQIVAEDWFKEKSWKKSLEKAEIKPLIYVSREEMDLIAEKLLGGQKQKIESSLSR